MIWLIGIGGAVAVVAALLVLVTIESGRAREDARRIEEFWAERRERAEREGK